MLLLVLQLRPSSLGGSSVTGENGAARKLSIFCCAKLEEVGRIQLMVVLAR